MVSSRIITAKKDFDLLYQKGKTVHGELFYFRYLTKKNTDEESSFGIIIGLKISKKAVERNKKRRQIKEIIRSNIDGVKKGFSVLLIAKGGILNAEYRELEKEFLILLDKAGMLKPK